MLFLVSALSSIFASSLFAAADVPFQKYFPICDENSSETALNEALSKLNKDSDFFSSIAKLAPQIYGAANNLKQNFIEGEFKEACERNLPIFEEQFGSKSHISLLDAYVAACKTRGCEVDGKVCLTELKEALLDLKENCPTLVNFSPLKEKGLKVIADNILNQASILNAAASQYRSVKNICENYQKLSVANAKKKAAPEQTQPVAKAKPWENQAWKNQVLKNQSWKNQKSTSPK